MVLICTGRGLETQMRVDSYLWIRIDKIVIVYM